MLTIRSVILNIHAKSGNEQSQSSSNHEVTTKTNQNYDQLTHIWHENKYQSTHFRKMWSQKWNIFPVLWKLALRAGQVR